MPSAWLVSHYSRNCAMQEILRLFSGNIKNPPSPLTSVLTLSQTWSQCEVPEACSSPGAPSPSTNMSYLHCKASPEFLNLTRQTPYNLEWSLHISSFGYCIKKSPGSSPGLLDPAGKTPLCTWELHRQPEILREGSGDLTVTCCSKTFSLTYSFLCRLRASRRNTFLRGLSRSWRRRSQ